MAQDGKTVVADGAPAPAPRLLFSSYHCYVDPSSGAAIATRDLLELLASHGWDVRVFCGPTLDFERRESLAQLLSDQGIAFEKQTFRRGGAPSPPAPLPREGEGRCVGTSVVPQTGEGSPHPDPLPKGEGSSVGTAGFSLLHFRQNGVPVSVFTRSGEGGRRLGRQPQPHTMVTPRGKLGPTPQPTTARTSLPADEGAAFLPLFERVLDEYRPDILLTYGGHWLTSRLMAQARERGAAVVFALHNFEYRDARLFQHTNAVLVPSQFCAEHYRRTLGLRCTAIPSPLNWSRVRCERSDAKQYVTFVNPQPNKGVFVFVRIAHELGRRRPDIPLLIVEGRGGVNWLTRTGLDLSRLENMSAMANTPDPRDFYRASRVVLMPSLWRESFGRVAAEALLNGIPVLASRRGALPEVLREAGFLFDIPERYTPESRIVASAEEVAPWVETAIRLWDDAAFYEQESRRSVAAAEAWRPERLVAQYDAFFRGLLGS